MDIMGKAIYVICPAYAGMILKAAHQGNEPPNLSRVCGDDPEFWNILDERLEFVPRMRG